jgi:hypothetical protein
MANENTSPTECLKINDFKDLMQMVSIILQYFKTNLLEALKGKLTNYIEAFLSKMVVWVKIGHL